MIKRLLLSAVCLWSCYGAAQNVFATATQPNSLNQDIAGVNGGVNSSSSWSSLGAASGPISPTPVPEPNAWVLGLTALALVALWKSNGDR